ncbi:sugar transferase [Roseovarius sp. LXJ103]|nr:sugar transferase [Roseovarius carneus]PWE37249.1 sugar transferase [Pelagicola sp. LXJ1103]
MSPSKRAFDIALALLLGLLTLPLMAILTALILITDGAPALYRSERMRTPEQSFGMLKFRTMMPAGDDTGVTGGDKRHRITRLGHLLRRTHLDELPQLWNVLVGEMSFVGPRPPLRQYVQAAPLIYRDVLRMRPGITGLASARLDRREARLLAASSSAAETEAIYLRRCVPVKARLDRIYAARRNFCWDLVILWQTVFGTRF